MSYLFFNPAHQLVMSYKDSIMKSEQRDLHLKVLSLNIYILRPLLRQTNRETDRNKQRDRMTKDSDKLSLSTV